jgi:hypothetical protein
LKTNKQIIYIKNVLKLEYDNKKSLRNSTLPTKNQPIFSKSKLPIESVDAKVEMKDFRIEKIQLIVLEIM